MTNPNMNPEDEFESPEDQFKWGAEDVKAATEWMKADLTKVAESGNAAALAEKFVQWKLLFDQLDDFFKEVSAIHDDIKSNIVPKVFQNDEGGAKTVTTNSGFRVTVTEKVYASAKGESKKEAKAWLREEGHEHVIVEQINASSLSSLAKSLAEENRELPGDLFNQFVKSGMSVTKVKAKKK